jgi:hypothetical protein
VLRYLSYQTAFRLVRFASLFIAPYYYIRIWLSPQKIRPREYFLNALAKERNGVTKAVHLILLLSIAARSYDAELAVRSIQTIKPPYPIWALSTREIRLLIEASLWFGEEQVESTIKEFLLSNKNMVTIPKLLAEYQSYILNWGNLAKADIDMFVLPAFYWEKLAYKLEIEGRPQESINALHKALHFVPESDPRRHEIVARFLAKQATASTRNPG